MSRIGRAPITIPAGVTVDVVENNVVTVKGPKGTLTQQFMLCAGVKKGLPLCGSPFHSFSAGQIIRRPQ